MPENKVGVVVMLAVSLLFASLWIPIAMSFINSAEMTNWHITVKFAFTFIPIVIFLFGIIAVFLLPKGKKAK